MTDDDGTEIPCDTEIDGNYYYIIQAGCLKCNAVHTLLDQDLHGWNGFVCREPEAESRPVPPMVAWTCAACGSEGHLLKLKIYSAGADFIEECGGQCDVSDWVNGFSWFGLDIRCSTCGNAKVNWGNKETM